MAATTENEAYNALVCSELAAELGPDAVYQLGDAPDEDRRRLSGALRGQALFEAGWGIDDVTGRTQDGWTFRRTLLTERFDFAAAQGALPEGAAPLLLLRRNGRIRFFTHAAPPRPVPGDTVVSFVPPRALRPSSVATVPDVVSEPREQVA